MNEYCRFIRIIKRGVLKPDNIGAVFTGPLVPNEDIIKIGLYPDNDSMVKDFNKLRNLLNYNGRKNASSFQGKGKDQRVYYIKRETHQVMTEEGYETFKRIQDFSNVDEFLKSERNTMI